MELDDHMKRLFNGIRRSHIGLWCHLMHRWHHPNTSVKNELLNRICFCFTPNKSLEKTSDKFEKPVQRLKEPVPTNKPKGKKMRSISKHDKIGDHPYRDKLLAYQYLGSPSLKSKAHRKKMGKDVGKKIQNDKKGGHAGMEKDIDSETLRLKNLVEFDPKRKSDDKDEFSRKVSPKRRKTKECENSPDILTGIETKKDGRFINFAPHILPDTPNDTMEVLDLSPLVSHSEKSSLVKEDLIPTKLDVPPIPKEPIEITDKGKSGVNVKPSTSDIKYNEEVRENTVEKPTVSEQPPPPPKFIEYYVYDYDVEVPVIESDGDNTKDTAIFIKKETISPTKQIKSPKSVRFMLPGKELEVLPTDEVSEHEYTYVEESYTDEQAEGMDDKESTDVQVIDQDDGTIDVSSSSYVYEYEDYTSAINVVGDEEGLITKPQINAITS